MVSTIDGQGIYIENKLNDLIKDYGDEHINLYIQFYENIFPINLRKFFSFLHYEINYLFKYMNSRIKNGHYTAQESRKLIFLLNEIRVVQSNVRATKYDFDIHPYYQERIKELEFFLSESLGSTIPKGFEKISLLETEPMFELKSSFSVKRSDEKVFYPLKLIGEGSYATVYKYKDEIYNCFFVIKKARKDLTEKELKRFKIEFEEMKKLNSPYVLEVYRFNEKKHEYIMEYADETLEKYISKHNNTLNDNERIGLVKQILRAFIYISSKNVLHRDISTKNVLIKKYDGLNVVKISDFGLVKRLDSSLTSKNTEFKGSLNDRKLEIIGFDKYEIHHETFALTRLIYFVLTGKKTISDFKDNKILEEFTLKGISDNVNDRYSTIKELSLAFDKVASTFN
ncbi:hypothetical protein BKP35_09030 [Anaerobacillus arseniciselenatis]|uniref:Protein kinase domain-containing protein n=1 Tax=Anaerobacillus arseniciselenatis TaxID=85682 RepID=A0A1S2LLG1_9BACI|nr:protein kinase family protein [Anaerobacillus arseniciselenatis]OIJ13368.1 hypothetical protein BKP35_09030 [Anaerobacillus arseniciselenatis]